MPAMLTRIHRKLRNSLARRGVLGTTWHTLSIPLHVIRDLSPRRRRGRAELAGQAAEFDRALGVETAGQVRLEGLEVVGNRDLGHFYLGSTPEEFRAAVGGLPICYEDYTLVDYGSGKGKALLLAARLPFRAVVGVEFSPELHAVATANMARAADPERRCRDARSVCADAALFEPPPGPLVLYFFNPFAEPILEAVLARVRASLAADPRDCWVSYNHLVCHGPLDRATWLELFRATAQHRVYRALRPVPSCSVTA